LENGLENYRKDVGYYPEYESDDGMILYKALYGDGIGPDFIAGSEDDTEPDGESDDGATVYLPELDPLNNPMKLMLVISGNPRKVVDPWSGAWNYLGGARYESRMNNPDFDLWSLGPDTKKETGDEIKNW
jgi:hypothetical protein